MWPLAAVIIDIALHRRGPDALPASKFLIMLLVPAYIVADLAVLSAGGLTSFQFGYLVFDSIFFFVFVFAVLRYFKMEVRYIQTAAALLGIEVLIDVIALPFAWLAWPDDTPNSLSVFELVYYCLFLWWVDVAGYILAKAIKQPYIVGLMLVVLYVMTSMSILENFTPAPA